MRKTILFFIITFSLIFQTFAGNTNFMQNVFYFPSANYYYLSDPDSEGFINGSFTIKKALEDEEIFGKMFNSLFPENSCNSNCGINKKKLLFEAVLKYNLEETDELENEVILAKTRYTNSDELEEDLQEIENKVLLLIENQDSFQNSWYETGNKSNEFSLCGKSIENGIVTHNFKKRFSGTQEDIYDFNHYILILPLGIDTGTNYDSISDNEFYGKNLIYIETLDDVENLSNISLIKKLNFLNKEENNFSFEINYSEIQEELENKLSEVYETYKEQELKINEVKLILFNEDNGTLKYIGNTTHSFGEDKDNSYYIDNCSSAYVIDNYESFDSETYNGGVNSIIATENNKFYLKKIDTIFANLDLKYDFWNLKSNLDKKDYYLILTEFKNKLEVYSEKLDLQIQNIFTNLEDIEKNKNKIENFFEKKMFIGYLLKKSNFRLYNGLVEYYDWPKDGE